MLKMLLRRRLFCACFALAGVGAWPGSLYAQEAEAPAWAQAGTLSEGWEAAGIEQFVADYTVLVDYARSSGRRWDQVRSAEDRRAQVDRAWSFLLDEQVMGQADLASVQTLIGFFAPTHKEYEDDRRTRLRDLYVARLSSELEAGRLDDEGLHTACKHLTAAGGTVADRAAFAQAWCEGRDLSSLSVRSLAALADYLCEPAVVYGTGTALYEGTIRMPGAGQYTFSRYLCGGVYANDWVVVRVGGRVVLDTRPDEDGGATVRGPIDLPAGDQPFTAEFYRADDPNLEGDVGPVEHLLLWEAQGLSRSLVPGGVFRQPPDHGGGAGLRARYYDTDTAGVLLAQEVVPAVDRLAGSYGHRYRARLSEVRALLTDPVRVGRWYEDLDEDPMASPDALAWIFRNACAVSGAADRAALADLLCRQRPEWVGALSVGWHMKTAMGSLAAVPGDTMVQFVQAWSSHRPRFQTRIGGYPGWSPEGYLKLNDDAYAHLGYVLGQHEAQWPVMQAVRDRCITEPGGGCDLEILKLYLETAKIASDPSPKRGWGGAGGLDEVIAYVDQQLDNATLSGDARATWLVARGICEEAFAGDKIPAPTAGRRWFELAYAAAESQDVRFWALGEQAVRLASMGEAEELASLLAAVGDQYTQDEQVEVMAYWTERAEAYARHYARGEDAQVLARQREVIASLAERLASAQAAGDADQVARYQRLVGQAEQALVQQQADFDAKWNPRPPEGE